MLIRLILKIMAKASIPLLLLVGSVSYSSYMLGHDPMAYFKGIGERGLNRVSGLFATLREGTSEALDTAAAFTHESDEISSGSKQVVYSWKDADGVTHYSSTAPNDTAVNTIHVDPNVNVVKSVRASVVTSKTKTKSSNQSLDGLPDVQTPITERLQGLKENLRLSSPPVNDEATRDVAEQLGGELPGISGKLLPGGSSSDGSSDITSLLNRLQQ